MTLGFWVSYYRNSGISRLCTLLCEFSKPRYSATSCCVFSYLLSKASSLYTIIVWESSKYFYPVGQLVNKSGIRDQMLEGSLWLVQGLLIFVIWYYTTWCECLLVTKTKSSRVTDNWMRHVGIPKILWKLDSTLVLFEHFSRSLGHILFWIFLAFILEGIRDLKKMGEGSKKTVTKLHETF